VILAVVGVLMSVVSAYYYLRVVVTMYMREPPAAGDVWPAVAPASTMALAISAALVLGLGVYPGPVLAWARVAAQSLR
jgi:NADH-quinone oxidoreductase subunit N